jgi:His-Xaa-Ser system radical SAM maturase HxsC
MIQLHARTAETWDADPVVLRVTARSHDLEVPPQKQVFLLGEDDPPSLAAFGAVFGLNREALPSDHPRAVILPDGLQYLSDGDVVRFIPRTGQLTVLYRKSSPFNSMLLTERCNSNCLMCSQPPRDVADDFLVDDILQAIPLMDRDTRELGITGGEPTLLGDRLLDVLRACKASLPRTGLHLLSNGRLFNYLSLCQAIADVGIEDLVIGIPLYSDLGKQHDFVVQAKGAFDQTIRGIANLARCGLRVELRVVLHQQTVSRLPKLAAFISRNLPFVEHVALMGLETIGHVKMNLSALWVDPVDYQQELLQAARELRFGRMNFSIYNHQLCVLHPDLWPYARQSISDWKNEYWPECDRCAVRGECGGFFSSAKLKYSAHIRAFSADEVMEKQPCST